VLLGCSLVVRTAAQPAVPGPEDRLEGAVLEAHLRFLASDELGGREAGTPGADVAARYIAEQFRLAGLQPVPGADEGYFQALETLPARNVLGFVEGTDPALKEEYVVLMAHYDHVGAGMDRGPGATAADSIFNGARDNGMGVAALLGAASALAEAPPRRSVLFLAVTAEEKGLLGSRFYVDHPLLPLDRAVYVLNIDGGGYSDTSAVTVIGLGRTSADALLREAAGAYRLAVVADPAPEQNLFDRSDNVSFARKGVPAPTFSPGFRAFSDPGIMDYYHQPRDEVDEAFDFAYLRRFVQAYARSARSLADAPDRPRWLPGDKYEAAARVLYGR
jgi:Zn-dependent M28 family amino/carboxypeptidase